MVGRDSPPQAAPRAFSSPTFPWACKLQNPAQPLLLGSLKASLPIFYALKPVCLSPDPRRSAQRSLAE